MGVLLHGPDICPLTTTGCQFADDSCHIFIVLNTINKRYDAKCDRIFFPSDVILQFKKKKKEEPTFKLLLWWADQLHKWKTLTIKLYATVTVTLQSTMKQS